LSGDATKPTFRVLTVTDRGAKSMAKQLCTSAEISAAYSAVEIEWLHRDQLSSLEIMEESYDLFWSRPRRVERLVPNLSDFYQIFLELPTYEVLWYSRQAQPQMSKGYFYRHSIGLLKDLESNSHFLLPLSQLKSMGVDLSRVKIIYYANYQELLNAFWSSEVDLISDGEWLQQQSGDQKLYWSMIDSKSSMGYWYIRKHRPAGIDCILLTGLRAIIGEDTFSNSKYKNSMAEGECI